jgi:hypothetical protein
MMKSSFILLKIKFTGNLRYLSFKKFINVVSARIERLSNGFIDFWVCNLSFHTRAMASRNWRAIPCGLPRYGWQVIECNAFSNDMPEEYR